MAVADEDRVKRNSTTKPPEVKPKERTAKVKEPAPSAPKAPAVVKRSVTNKGKQQAGNYSTGPDERKVITQGGTTVRMAPNSTLKQAPKAPSTLRKLLDIFKGKKKNDGSGNFGGVRG